LGEQAEIAPARDRCDRAMGLVCGCSLNAVVGPLIFGRPLRIGGLRPPCLDFAFRARLGICLARLHIRAAGGRRRGWAISPVERQFVGGTAGARRMGGRAVGTADGAERCALRIATAGIAVADNARVFLEEGLSQRVAPLLSALGVELTSAAEG
jgi:hypothetical protein